LQEVEFTHKFVVLFKKYKPSQKVQVDVLLQALHPVIKVSSRQFAKQPE